MEMSCEVVGTDSYWL